MIDRCISEISEWSCDDGKENQSFYCNTRSRQVFFSFFSYLDSLVWKCLIMVPYNLLFHKSNTLFSSGHGKNK